MPHRTVTTQDELDQARDRIKQLEAELAAMTADRDSRCIALGRALRALGQWRKAYAV
jgi:hypothetical protein